jgi:hypothetical protein
MNSDGDTGLSLARPSVRSRPHLWARMVRAVGLAMLGRLTEGEGCAEYTDQKG